MNSFENTDFFQIMRNHENHNNLGKTTKIIKINENHEKHENHENSRKYPATFVSTFVIHL